MVQELIRQTQQLILQSQKKDEQLQVIIQQMQTKDQQHREEIRHLVEQRQRDAPAVTTQIMKDLADSMIPFTYGPENNAIFETWYNSYKPIFTTAAIGLSREEKIQLLLQKFSHFDYQRFADSLLPREPTDFTLEEAVKQLKHMFAYKNKVHDATQML